MTARVHVVRSKRTVAEIQDKERAQQWNPPPGYKRKTDESQFSIANEALDDYGAFKDKHYVFHISDDDAGKGSSLSAFLNIICVAIGVGSLQLSYALRQSGWVGLLFVFVAGTVAFITSIITVRCMYLKAGGGKISGFHEIGLEAFGKPGYYIVSAFNMLGIIGSVGIYAILSANNISEMLARVNVHLGSRFLMLITTATMCIPTLLTRTLGETFLVSLIGTATSIIATLIVIVMAIVYPIRNGEMHISSSVTHSSPIHHFAALPSGFAVSLSTMSFAYVGSTIVPHLESGMQHPEKFGRVFGSALFVVTCIYMVMASTGYSAYGDRTLSPITLNFPRTWPTFLADICITIHVLFAGPLFLVQMALEIESGLDIASKGKRAEVIWRLCVRIGAALVILGMAEALPFFEDVISLVSALTSPVLVYLTPIAAYIKLKGWRNIRKRSLLGLMLLLAFGIVVSAFGLAETIRAIVGDFRNEKLST
ncbi:hypothetical protein DL89DRAFT_251364 [Linderina pennispora]|uniref:Amino acid transporter transmembrane domain-containing protein n=1 Tax=Linderina pennispora TaxID=61395 RepID=A0A1Y1VUU0_9FUNG|nr:uncharacterized protein DL89DRAFT_251364 [Linderina pennispora]ORX64786.1 hypothetical protein DL89DRAFT_251364 [Linderina pennispora]